MTYDRRSYTSGHFELQIDGHSSTAYLKSLEGGFVSASTVDEPLGSDVHHVKHVSTVEIEPFTIDFSLAGARDIMKWIEDSWNKKFMRRNGQITHADFNLKNQFEHHFREALIMETTFPTLDGSAKEAAYMKLKILPEFVNTKKGNDAPLSPANPGTKHKMWTANSFRFFVNGMDEMKYVNKIESFTVKQGIKKLWIGKDRFPQIEPTKIEFPTITGTISLEYAAPLLKWHDEYIVQGKRDTTQQKEGGIEFLSQDRKDVIFGLDFHDMGITKVAIEPSKANAESVKRVQFTIFMERMTLSAENKGLES